MLDIQQLLFDIWLTPVLAALPLQCRKAVGRICSALPEVHFSRVQMSPRLSSLFEGLLLPAYQDKLDSHMGQGSTIYSTK